MNKIAKFILFLICFSFIVSYIIYETGYYEYKLQNRTVFTKEQMEQFEKDVNAGKDVTLNDYLIETEVDYTNKLTDATVKVSTKVNDYLKKGVELIFRQVNKMVQEENNTLK